MHGVKNNMLRIAFVLMAVTGMVLPVSQAHAAEATEPLPELHWHFEGVTGSYDKAALQRGFQVYREVCAACHSMEYLSYRNLSDLGYSEAEVKAIAASYLVTDGPNDEGEMYERSGLPSDRFVSPYPNREAAMSVNNGAYPPDLSLIAKARHGGANYIYAILTGFEEPPHGKELLPGQYWNRYMPGHVISMAPPLFDGQVSYSDGSPESVSQYARDVAAFLSWASEPTLEARKYTGLKVLMFLLVFAGVLYAVKKKVWADQH